MSPTPFDYETHEMELARRAILQNPEMVLIIRPKYVTEHDWEYAISANPKLFRHCRTKPYSVCMTALSIDGMNLSHIDPLKYTGDQYQNMCDLAVKTTPKAINLVPKEFRTKKMKAMAYANDPELLLSEKKMTDGMIKSILDHNPSFIRQVENPSDDLVIYALGKDPRCIVYFPVISQRVREFFEENFPQYASMFHDF